MQTIRCERCGLEFGVGAWPFCPHSPHSNFTVVPDSIPGGRVVENLDPIPTRYDSKTAIKDRMRELGVENRVRHVPEQGSDKSKLTSRWI